MSKFCGNCGSQMDDSATVCGYCGAPLQAATGASSKPAGLKNFDIKKIGDFLKQESNKKLLTICGAGVAGLIALIIIIAIIVGNTGCKGLAKKYMKAFENGDQTAIADLYCDFIDRDKDLNTDTIDEAIDNIKDGFENSFDSSDYKIGYEIEEIEELSDKKIRELKKQYTGDYESKVKALDDFKIIKIRIEATKKGGKSHESEKINLTVAKEDGSWKILRDTSCNAYNYGYTADKSANNKDKNTGSSNDVYDYEDY